MAKEDRGATSAGNAATGIAGAAAPAFGAAVKKPRIGEALVSAGVLSEAQLKRILIEQQTSGRMLGEMLIEQGLVTPGHLVQILGRTLGVRGCQLRHGLIDPTLLNLIG